jgi:hypothetical protein
MTVKGQEEKCVKCGRKKPFFGYLIQCVSCKRWYCKQCASNFTKLDKSQKLIDSCPECREKI